MEGNDCDLRFSFFRHASNYLTKKINKRVVSVFIRLVGFVEDKSAVWNLRGLRCHAHG